MAKHYAISDIHGMYDIYEQVCAMLQPDDIVYFLGDAGDRGYNNWKCVKAIYENPQWIYLKGNHEDMMAKGTRQIQDEISYLRGDDDHDIWMWNGGRDTEDGFYEDSPEKDPESTAWVWDWVRKLEALPLTAEYTNSQGITFHMSHAGYTCGRKDEMWGDSLIWSRDHFLDHWDEKTYEHDICIHGHTPLEYLVEDLNRWQKDKKPYIPGEPEARTYCDGHKICIDNGVFYTGATVLYDLDEMKAIPLFDRKFKNTVEC